MWGHATARTLMAVQRRDLATSPAYRGAKHIQECLPGSTVVPAVQKVLQACPLNRFHVWFYASCVQLSWEPAGLARLLEAQPAFFVRSGFA